MNIFTSLRTNRGDWAEKFGPFWTKSIEKLKAKFGTSIEEVRMPGAYPTDVPIVFVNKAQIVEVLSFLKTDTDCGYNFLADYTATDEEAQPRFELVFNLYNRDQGPRIRVKVKVAEGEESPTCISVWPGCDWAEREIYDMYGIKFTGHPNLRRILMDYRWEGYPLRKDYPLDGYQVFPDSEAPDPERLK